MAEASDPANEEPPPMSSQVENKQYYCHICTRYIEPVFPELTCPSCSNGFIEEVLRENVSHSRRQPPATLLPPLELWSRHILEDLEAHGNHSGGGRGRPTGRNARVRFRRFDPRNGNASRSGSTDGASTSARNVESVNEFFEILQSLTDETPEGHDDDFLELDTEDDGGQRPRGGQNMWRSQSTPGSLAIVQQILNNLTAGFGGVAAFPMGNIIYGNPGDYAFGRQELDVIITQLLNQAEGGPPPAPADRIESLPMHKVTAAEVEVTLQCAVCMEDYSEGEEVREMPCLHKFHPDCLIPWLQLHGTCPVCRKNLDGVDTSAAQASEWPVMEQADGSNRPGTPAQYDELEDYD